MSIKSFNVDDEIYSEFSKYCRENGISMSKQVETFMKSIIEEDPEIKKEYIEKLNKIRKGKFIQVNEFAKRYGLEE